VVCSTSATPAAAELAIASVPSHGPVLQAAPKRPLVWSAAQVTGSSGLRRFRVGFGAHAAREPGAGVRVVSDPGARVPDAGVRESDDGARVPCVRVRVLVPGVRDPSARVRSVGDLATASAVFLPPFCRRLPESFLFRPMVAAVGLLLHRLLAFLEVIFVAVIIVIGELLCFPMSIA
jgi:hypothetical protein